MSNTYPRILYRGAALSGDMADQRIVTDEAGELAAAAENYFAWDGKSKAAPKSAAAPATLEAEQAAFQAADKPAGGNPDDDDEPQPERRPGVARGRQRQG